MLGVSATGATVGAAQQRAYAAVDRIDWPGGFCRRDIGYLAVAREKRAHSAFSRIWPNRPCLPLVPAKAGPSPWPSTGCTAFAGMTERAARSVEITLASCHRVASGYGARREKRMTTIDRQAAYTGTKDVAAPLRFDVARLEAYLAANARGFKGPLTRASSSGRAVEPDLHAGNAGAQIRAAAQAARQAASLRARGRPRVPRDQRAARAGLPGRRAGGLLRRRERHRHGVLRDGLRRRPRDLGAGHAGLQSGRAHRRVRRDERDARAAAFLRARRDRACPTTAAARTTSRARSTAGRSSTAPPRPRRSTRWSA